MNYLAVFTIAVVLTALFALAGPIYSIISSYANGRKVGGYPLFAKFRRKTCGIYACAYQRGLNKSRDKIAKGGYR